MFGCARPGSSRMPVSLWCDDFNDLDVPLYYIYIVVVIEGQDGGASKVENIFTQSQQAHVPLVVGGLWADHENIERRKTVRAGLPVFDAAMRSADDSSILRTILRQWLPFPGSSDEPRLLPIGRRKSRSNLPGTIRGFHRHCPLRISFTVSRPSAPQSTRTGVDD